MERKNPHEYWWARLGSNQEPTPYEGIPGVRRQLTLDNTNHLL